MGLLKRVLFIVLAISLAGIVLIHDRFHTQRLDRISLNSTALPKGIHGPQMDANFPDPCYIEVNGTYYAFATNKKDQAGPDQINIQVAKSSDFETWNLTGKDALPYVGSWSTGDFVWAPDVVQADDGTFVLYYTAQHAEQGDKHCTHVATSKTVEGPYTPIDTDVLLCPLDIGGAIDPEGFKDADGTRYLVYKIDGNSLNREGEPWHPTPIMLQELDHSGTKLVGKPIKLLDRIPEEDGPLIEAPAMGRYKSDSGKAVYVLFYSSDVFDSANYDVSYATSDNVTGPFKRSEGRLLKSGDGDGRLVGPGGLDVGVNGTMVVFHSIKPGSQEIGLIRKLWTAEIEVKGTNVTIPGNVRRQYVQSQKGVDPSRIPIGLQTQFVL